MTFLFPSHRHASVGTISSPERLIVNSKPRSLNFAGLDHDLGRIFTGFIFATPTFVDNRIPPTLFRPSGRCSFHPKAEVRSDEGWPQCPMPLRQRAQIQALLGR